MYVFLFGPKNGFSYSSLSRELFLYQPFLLGYERLHYATLQMLNAPVYGLLAYWALDVVNMLVYADYSVTWIEIIEIS